MMSEISKTVLSASPESKQPASLVRPKFTAGTSKRKRSGSNDRDLDTVVINSAKQRKSKKSKRAELDEYHDLDLDQGLNLAIANLDSRLLADYVTKRTKHIFPDLSLVELEDANIPGIFCRPLFQVAEVGM